MPWSIRAPEGAHFTLGHRLHQTLDETQSALSERPRHLDSLTHDPRTCDLHKLGVGQPKVVGQHMSSRERQPQSRPVGRFERPCQISVQEITDNANGIIETLKQIPTLRL
ncbi:MAG TPA: hypothetical protein DEV93_19760 [Chloroflexi bacterium]|jgi:hypothetical protein|nr:hypothetical protein [Chloroflexota bacterium]